MINSKKIEYFSKYNNINFISPSKDHIPEWYKQTKSFFGGEMIIDDKKIQNKTFKMCIPFLDSITSGYTVFLWQDCFIKKDSNGISITWPDEPEIVGVREKEMSYGIPTPAGHIANSFWWYMPFSIKTPRGYSLMITHPLNRFDLPFTTISGIVDSDIVMTDGKIPFFLKDNFEGMIPKGTPIFQILPFKRDSWIISYNKKIEAVSNEFVSKAKQVFYGFYKKNIWQRKYYK